MKTKFLILSIIAILMASLGLEAQITTKEHNKTVTFDVSMTCENCQKTIQKNIAFEKGIKDMQVDLPSKRVTLKFDTRKTNEQKIVQAFEELGYTAVLVKDLKSVKID
jgi:copper chaperone CopZ